MAGGQSGRLAHGLALAVPAGLLGGAYISEFVFGLYPCEMCWWQRYPHFVALALALVALAPVAILGPARRGLLLLAALAILVSGLIGGFHAGVEYGWWEGLTSCGNLAGGGLDAIMNAPLVRCDAVQWSLLGISLAGFNFLFSTGAAIAILALLAKGPRHG